jgi:DNA polymerase elongation subunit (family B)
LRPPAQTFNTPIPQSNQCVIDIETTNFEPWSGKIICIGIKDIYSGETQVFQDEHEESMLIQFLQYFNKKSFREIIGFNIPYDMRYIFAKCVQYKIPTNRLFSIRQTDLMMILKSVTGGYNFNQPGTLDDWTQALLGRKKLFHNIQIPELYRAGRIQDIIEYNINDLELTHELWKRITFVLAGGIYIR